MIKLFAALGLGVTAGALALANLVLYDTPVDISPTAPSAQRSAHDLKAGAAGLPTAADGTGFAETFERPLFTPTRRKFVPVTDAGLPAQVAAAPALPAQPVASAPAAPLPALLGISINGTGAQALLKSAGADQADWYGNGQTVDGWTVASVDKDAATLQRDGKSTRLLLYPPVLPAAPAGGGDGL